MPNEGSARIPIRRITPTGATDDDDLIAIEEPLEIRIAFGPAEQRTERSISITMRTPGDDLDLAAGFLFTEGIAGERESIESMGHCGRKVGEESNVVRVELGEGIEVDLKKLDRNFYTASSCGVCGKSSIEALDRRLENVREDGTRIRADLLMSLPEQLREAQINFDATGGVHAAALFDQRGELLRLREDVGRHNAVDKLIGSFLREGRLPLHDTLLLVSGRASFELVQKALAARIPVLAAVGAPSSLARDLAAKHGMTLVGFLRERRFNVYSGAERIS